MCFFIFPIWHCFYFYFIIFFSYNEIIFQSGGTLDPENPELLVLRSTLISTAKYLKKLNEVSYSEILKISIEGLQNSKNLKLLLEVDF